MSDTTPSLLIVAVPGPTGPRPHGVRARPDATLAELLAVLGERLATVDGRAVTPTCRLAEAGVREGSLVGGPVEPPGTQAAVEARWVTGPDAGRRHPLGAGAVVVGRAAAADLRADDAALAPFAAALVADAEIARLSPLARHAGATMVALGDPIAIGASRLVLAPVPDEPPAVTAPAGSWSAALARPPRRPTAAEPALPSPVPPPPERPAAVPLALTPVVAAAASGLLVAALTGRPLLALVGLVGALAGLGATAGQRWRAARRHGRAVGAWQAATRDLAGALAQVAGETARHRRLVTPDAVRAVARCLDGSSRLWERRPGHADAHTVTIGLGDRAWEAAPDHVLADVPVSVRVGPGDALGIVGDAEAARAVARSVLVQLVAAHGPADLAIAVAGDPAPWAWTAWLPHDVELLGFAAAASSGLLVLDGDDLATTGPPAGEVATLVLATRPEALAAWCTAVLDLRGRPVLDGEPVDPAAMSLATATGAARALARFVDPEHLAARVPDAVDFDALPGHRALDAAALAARWRASDGVPRCVLGRTAEGPLELDLDRDGPHALVAGTTGAGKSELLRTLVAGLALTTGPEDLTFLLVDFKGGAAFDACADLPHVVGMVTDLDGTLAPRVLRSLEAELRRREHVLRACGASDLAAHRRLGGVLARLVVVVDELATLVAELPGFVPALVSLAQRGRSLGVHLVLATQRPRGAITDDVRANTALRICLRTTEREEAVDVVADPRPAAFRRDRPGRAAVRRGEGRVEVVQVAHASGAVADAGAPVAAAGEEPAFERSTQLVWSVRLACEAATLAGILPPRRPWLAALPTLVRLADLPAGSVALLDDPDRQAQPPYAWDRGRGHLLVCGAAGSGTSGALLAVGAAAATASAADVHLYAVDADGSLATLAALAHTGDVLAAGDRSRVARLLRRLRAGIEHGRPAGAPAVVLLVDGLDALRASFDDVAGLAVLADLASILADGPARGVHVAASIRRPGGLPASMTSAFAERWLLRLADPSEAAAWGVPAQAVTASPPGRAAVVGGGPGEDPWRAAQVAMVGEDDLHRLGGVPAPAGRAEPIGALPALVGTVGRPSAGPGRLVLPIGLADDDLGPVSLVLHAGDHLLVAGPPRSGRTSALRLLVLQVRRASPDVHVVVAGPTGERLRAVADAHLDDARLHDTGLGAQPLLVVVDDAERVDDDGRLAALAARPDVHLLVAARADALRGLHGHWTQAVRRRRSGLLLSPGRDDGDLLGVVLPRRPWTAWVPGRAELVDAGHVRLVQLARPPSPRRRRAA